MISFCFPFFSINSLCKKVSIQISSIVRVKEYDLVAQKMFLSQTN